MRIRKIIEGIFIRWNSSRHFNQKNNYHVLSEVSKPIKFLDINFHEILYFYTLYFFWKISQRNAIERGSYTTLYKMYPELMEK